VNFFYWCLAGQHCMPGLVHSGVQNVQNGFEDGWCTPSTALGVHFGCHADIWQPSTHLNKSPHCIQHKTTHTQRSNPRRHRTHLGRGPTRSRLPCPGLSKERSQTCKTDLKTAVAPLLLLEAFTLGAMLTFGSPAPI
jgi:hypothetical protein